jgi:hypothetical protein
MKSSIVIMAVVAIVVGAPVVADSQVVAGPDMTLTEAAQAKFNRESPTDDRHFKPVPGSSGIPAPLYASAGLTPEEGQGWTLEQVFVAKINRESRGDDRQLLPVDASATSTGLAFGQDADYSQLALSAGLSREEAAGMSFADIAEAKLNAEH